MSGKHEPTTERKGFPLRGSSREAGDEVSVGQAPQQRQPDTPTSSAPGGPQIPDNLRSGTPAPDPDPACHCEERSDVAIRSPRPSASPRAKTLRALRNLLLKLAVIALLILAALHFVFGVFVAHSNDMYPALRDGDLCITYRPHAPVYGDVVAYTADGQRHFGRVVGMPGDVIDMDADGHYTVNGNLPYETVYYETRAVESSPVTFPYTVPEGALFLLNDLRDNPQDSRLYGAIPSDAQDGALALLFRRRGW